MKQRETQNQDCEITAKRQQKRDCEITVERIAETGL